MQKKLTYLLFFIALFFTFNQLEAACNWKNRNPYFYPSDSCNTNLKKYSVNGYIAFQYPGSCLKYTWKVNGNVVGTSNMVIHPVTSNGTYVISVTVRDTCNNCDTTFTSSRTISCIPKCNWKAKNLSILGGDSCSQYPYKPSIRVFLYGSTSCAKYTWKVNGNFVSNGLVLNYKATQNGTYNLSVNVRDTCNNCDTTYTKSITITCATNCNWKGKNATFSIYDSCSTYKIPNFISGIYFQNNSSSCMKYTWKVNGTTIYTGTRNYISYYPKQNGTYNVTVNVRDTCNNCDTTYTQSLTVTCATKCNWSNKNAIFYIIDSCSKSPSKPNFLNYLYFQSNTSKCLKFTYKVNGTTIYSGPNSYKSYFPTQNGTYNVTVNVRDTCANCDTTYSKSVTITCAGNKCAWYKRNMYFNAWDSCNGRGKNKISLNGYIGPYAGCYKYTWLLNGVVVSQDRSINYGITKNGTYNLCMKVTDTCDNCDTTFCKSFNITCISNSPCYMPYQRPGYKLNCDTIIFESGNIDTCVTYLTRRYSPSTGKVDTISNKRVFTYIFKDTGLYYFITSYHNKCKNCDTAIYTRLHVTCKTGTSNCRWANSSRQISFNVWDSCNGRGKNKVSINGYITTSPGCYKYKWKLNGTIISNDAATQYGITKNGSYNLCMTILDTCSKCDTTYCKTLNINCFSTCNWKSRITANNYFDSCNGVGYANSLNGYVAMNQNYKTSCYTYRWTVNGAYVGNKYYFHTPIYLNGAYNVCVKITDTCTKCDTTICSRRVVNCNNLGLKNNSLNVVKIYPNPASNNLNIESSQASEYTEILSVDGKAVWSGKLEEGINNIVTDQWARGIYIVRVKTVSGISNYKIILE